MTRSSQPNIPRNCVATESDACDLKVELIEADRSVVNEGESIHRQLSVPISLPVVAEKREFAEAAFWLPNGVSIVVACRLSSSSARAAFGSARSPLQLQVHPLHRNPLGLQPLAFPCFARSQAWIGRRILSRIWRRWHIHLCTTE